MAAVSVTTSATRLDTAGGASGPAGSAIAVYNNGASTVYLGGASVTTSSGFPLAAGASFAVDLKENGDVLYGIVASGTVEVRTLELGV
jgi:hypothetical protein